MHLRRNTLYWVLCIIVKIVFSACWITHVLRNLIASLTLSLTNPVNFCAENCPHLPRPDPHTQTHACKQNMFPSCNNSTFTTVHFDIHSFTCYREEEGKENVLRISSFALCLVVFERRHDRRGSERVKAEIVKMYWVSRHQNIWHSRSLTP